MIHARCIAAIVLFFWALPGPALGTDDGIVDPFAVIAALDGFASMPLWPGFDPSTQPAAIYDGKRTLLLRHPDPPEEFSPLKDHEGVWVAEGQHPAVRWNSTVDLGGVRTATLMLTIQPGRSVDQEAGNLLHEVFHVFSKPRHPTWKPDEMYRYSYPLEDEENYRLLLLEEEDLARALEAEKDTVAAGWAASGLRRRRQRTQSLNAEHLRFETALEMQEGTAVYVARLALGTPRDTSRLRRARTPEKLRWRFYDTGAALAALLDRVEPSWKERIEAQPALTMDTLLGQALRRRDTLPAELPASEREAIRARAQAAVAQLAGRRARIRKEFLARAPRVVVIASEGSGPLRLQSFDPLALEILQGGEALHPRRLALESATGEIAVENPRYQRGSLEGVVAFTVPSGSHPFLEGVQRVTVSGFAGKPEVDRKDDVVTVEAEGLRLSFQNAVVRTAGDEIQVLLPKTR